MAKFVQITSYVEWPTGTPRSDQFSSFNLESVRAELEASVFDGGRHDVIAKGTYKGTLNAKVRPDSDWAFVTLLIQQLDGEADIPILYRPKTGAKATDNPEMTGSIAVTKAPSLGGDRNTVLESDLQFQFNTAITYDNSSVTVTLG